MVKIEGTQDIPAEWEDEYIALLAKKNENDVVQKRYPFDRPNWQEGGGLVKPGQEIQRGYVKLAIEKFADCDEACRARWYAAAPEWGSFLWYYNYFIMSALQEVPAGYPGVSGVIKSIQVVKETVTVGGNKTFSINTVDPAKTVVMMFGNSYIADAYQRFSGTAADGTEVTKNLSPNVNIAIAEVKVYGEASASEVNEGTGSGRGSSWVCSYLSTSQVKIALVNIQSPISHGYFIEVIEHKAQTVYPVITSIGANAVVIDWSLTPSVGADISIIVIEYV